MTCFNNCFPFGHRYFPKFNKVDKHNQMRQHELNIEGKWGTDDAFFRLFCTLFGMTVVDTMLAVKAESHPCHAVRHQTTKGFAELLCEEMLANKLDGAKYDPKSSTARRARPVNGQAAADTDETDGEEHVLVSYGRKSDFQSTIARGSKGDYRLQHPCVVCGKKTGTYCSRSGCKLMHKRELSAPPVCDTGKRQFLLKHANSQAITEAEAAVAAGWSKHRRTLNCTSLGCWGVG